MGHPARLLQCPSNHPHTQLAPTLTPPTKDDPASQLTHKPPKPLQLHPSKPSTAKDTAATMSADDQNTQLLHAMIQIFQPSRADCERMAKIMDNGVTANALRQRIAKLRNKLNANNGGGGGGSVASTPASTTKRGGRNKKAAANPELDYDGNGDSGSAAVTPSKNSRARGASGGGRKRVTYDDDNDDGIAAENEAEELKAAATKKTKTMTAAAGGKKAKQKEAAVVKQEEELDIEHEVVAGDGGDVGVVAANAILDDVALSALEDGEAEQLIDQGSFFYLQDEDEAV